MNMLKSKSHRPLSNERGAEILEVGIYCALVIAAAIVLLGPIGAQIVASFTAILNAMTAAL